MENNATVCRRNKSIIITEIRQLKKLYKEMKNVDCFAFDTETNTLNALSDNSNFLCVGISISWGTNNNYYIPINHRRDEDILNQLSQDVIVKYLKPIFSRPDVKILGWNLKFDFHVLKRLGIDIKTNNILDGMLMSWLIDENTPNGLKENSMSLLGVSQEHFKEVTKSVPSHVKKQFGFKSNQKVTFDLVTIKEGAPYALDDAYFSYCNCIVLEKMLVDEGMDKIYEKMYVPFLKVLFDMEEQGVRVNIKRLKKMKKEMERDLEKLQYKIYELVGAVFNINSTEQKQYLLFGYEKKKSSVPIECLPKYLQKAYQEKDFELLYEKGFQVNNGIVYKFKYNPIEGKSFSFAPISATAKGAPSVDNNTIWILSNKQYKNKRKMQGVEVCKCLAEYSKITKLKSAFVDGILELVYKDKKVHPSFNQIGTDSGRLSCSSPNLQQLPKAEENDKYQIRSVFIGSMGKNGKRKKIIALDYHNLEMVCLTHFSKDKNLSKMFANDDDAHGSTAVNMFGLDCTPTECKKQFPHLRQAAKTINFMLMYGGGANTLYENLKNDHFSPLDLGEKKYLEEYKCNKGVEVAQKFIDRYFMSYSGVAQFIKKQKRLAHQHGYVMTILQRKRRLKNINSSDRALASYEERLAVNSTIQGTAGDITINAQLRIANDPWFKKHGCNMLIQVHDELVFECPEEYCEEAIQRLKYYMERPFGDNESRRVQYLRADCDGYYDNYQEAK